MKTTLPKPRNSKRNDMLNRKIGSMTEIPTYIRTKFKLTNNVTSLVKKYANYIFKELKLDKTKD